MLKTLFLVRHAKAQQDSIDHKDFSRELADRGIRDASLVGSYLKKQGITIDMIISSPAARAFATAELMANQLGYNIDNIHRNEELYLASVRTFLQVINQLKDDWNNVLLTSHNPAITYLAEYISNAEIGNMPTASVAILDFKIKHWQEISQNTGALKTFISPRMIKDNIL